MTHCEAIVVMFWWHASAWPGSLPSFCPLGRAGAVTPCSEHDENNAVSRRIQHTAYLRMAASLFLLIGEYHLTPPLSR
jgi:hypothetical protein